MTNAAKVLVVLAGAVSLWGMKKLIDSIDDYLEFEAAELSDPYPEEFAGEINDRG